MPPLLFRCSFGFVHKGGDLIHLNFGNGTAGLVDAAQLDRIALHGADLQRDGRADDERLAGLLQHGNVIQRFVVALVTVGNGFLSWYLLLILIMLVTSIIGYQKNKKRGAQDGWQSMGLGTAAASGRMGWGLLGRCALLVLCMLAYLYVLLLICEKAFLLDFRFIWPFFKTFDAARFGQFCVYLPVFALFFILNNSKIMASARCKATYQPGFKGFLGCWWCNALMMVGGILIIVLIEYIPFFMNIAPGADLLFGSTFGGPFMSLLILFVPQVLVFSVLCPYTYRRTDSVYIGALTAASLACWIVTGGSSML